MPPSETFPENPNNDITRSTRNKLGLERFVFSFLFFLNIQILNKKIAVATRKWSISLSESCERLSSKNPRTPFLAILFYDIR
jgi:hypothetical protein